MKMKVYYKIKQIIPATVVREFTVEADSPEEAYDIVEKNKHLGYVEKPVILHDEDVTYSYPEKV